MSTNLQWFISLLLVSTMMASNQATASKSIDSSTPISAHQAANLMQLPLNCAETEYPNKPSPTIGSLPRGITLHIVNVYSDISRGDVTLQYRHSALTPLNLGARFQ